MWDLLSKHHSVEYTAVIIKASRASEPTPHAGLSVSLSYILICIGVQILTSHAHHLSEIFVVGVGLPDLCKNSQ